MNSRPQVAQIAIIATFRLNGRGLDVLLDAGGPLTDAELDALRRRIEAEITERGMPRRGRPRKRA